MLDRLFARTPDPEVRNVSDWGAWQGDVAPVAAGVPVNADTSMGLLAFSGCVLMIADAIATLPVDVFRGSGDTRTEVTKPGWLARPTVDLDFTDWATQVITSLLIWGNAYLAVTRSGLSIVEVVPLPPDLVTPRRVKGRKVYIVNGAEYPGEILHIKAPMMPGSDVGLAPLDYARQSVGLGLAAQEYGASSIRDGNNMPGVLEFPRRMQPGQMKETAATWRRARSGKAGRGLPGVVDDGGTWKPTGVTNEQAQFLQPRQWTAAEIAAQVFFIDPRELGIPLTGSTLEYVNAESRSAAFNTKGLLRWTTRLETALSGLLPRPQYVKLNLSARLRGNSVERWAQYEAAARINTAAVAVGMPPVMTTEEMRALEDWGKLDPTQYEPNPTPDPVPSLNAADIAAEVRRLMPEP